MAGILGATVAFKSDTAVAEGPITGVVHVAASLGSAKRRMITADWLDEVLSIWVWR